jgi:hypothetical protein
MRQRTEGGEVKISGGPIEKPRIEARYAGKCCNCTAEIAKGDSIVYFPAPKARPGARKQPKARIMCDECASAPAQERADRREAAGR